MHAVASLPSLRDLRISDTLVTGEGIRSLASLPRLESLTFFSNRISGVDLPAFAALPALRHLSIGSKYISADSLTSLEGMSNLESLTLHRAPIGDEGAAITSRLPALTRLELVETALTDEGLRSIASMNGLSALHIESLSVTDAALDRLSCMKNLRELTISPGVTDSGLKYRILRKSDGKKPGPTDRVKVNYQGWLDNGEEFDSSYGKDPFEFSVERGVIKGWLEGNRFVDVGGMIELEIPGKLGYPTGGPGGAGSTLHFTIELIEILD